MSQLNLASTDASLWPTRPPPPQVVAITGGAGFIGSHIAERLVGAGHRVICIDNFQTGSSRNIEHLAGVDGFMVVEHDISEPLPESLPRFDQIFNFACPASPVHYQADRVRTALTCANGALHVLQRAERDGARIVHASTSEVYGDPTVHPQSEGYFGNVNTVGPRSCYDEGKRFAETLLTDYAAQADLDVRILRIFNTYGPRMQPDDGRVVSNFIIQALLGADLTLYGDGSQTRSFCFVDDLVDGCLRLMEAGSVEGPVNLGNPAEITVRDLAETVVEMTGSRSSIRCHPLPVDDPRRRRPDISKAMRILDWSPAVPLADGLARTIAYFADQLGFLSDDGSSRWRPPSAPWATVAEASVAKPLDA